MCTLGDLLLFYLEVEPMVLASLAVYNCGVLIRSYMYCSLEASKLKGCIRIFSLWGHVCMKTGCKAFFLDGPGGTGKTLLFKALLAKPRSEGNMALVVASAALAATLLPGGSTAHARFGIPIPVNEESPNSWCVSLSLCVPLFCVLLTLNVICLL